MQKLKWLPAILGIIVPISIPILCMLTISYWCPEYTRVVDRQLCSCSCWDTVFKGPYETGSITHYKHLYFNATSNMAKIWLITVITIIAIYECVKYLSNLIINHSIRYSMLFLYCIINFSHYYAIWMYIGYYNDDFYSQWNHQTFFTLTELLSTGMVLHLANSRHEVTSRKILCIVGLAVLHIIAGGFDQFVENVLNGKGMFYQQIRDVGLMVPDIFHVVIPMWLYCETRREMKWSKLLYRDRTLKCNLIMTCVAVFVLLIIYQIAL